MIYKVKSRETNKIDELSSGIALIILYTDNLLSHGEINTSLFISIGLFTDIIFLLKKSLNEL